MIDLPLIIYIPGLLPKPEPSRHRDALFRCLIAGVRRQDEQVALDIASNLHCFDLVSWTYDFYREHRDIGIDADAIDAVTQQPFAAEQDISEATNWKRRLVLRLFALADFLPFLIPHVANERIEMHLRDLWRYLHNSNDIAEHIRQHLKMPLRAAAESNRPILLLAHSMGSVIAYDSLWQLTHDHHDEVSVDLLVTMGSPLGQRYIQKRIKGNSADGVDRYPGNVNRWINLTSQGDLTAVDPTLADDFGEMVKLGLVESIEDERIFNYFRLNGQLNVHAEYGYLANDTTARIVADWWRSARMGSEP
jgi:hypothetical protein